MPGPSSFSSFTPSSVSVSESDDSNRSTQWMRALPFQLDRQVYRYRRKLQIFLDRVTPMTVERWSCWAGLLLLFAFRIRWAGGFYIVAYALAIYNLNLLLGFLQPLDVGELQGEGSSGGRLPTRTRGHSSGRSGSLSVTEDDRSEYRPFVRRLPEFSFWWQSFKSLLLALTATLFPWVDIPVYWPVLVLYFLVLFGVTMKRQLQHMREYGYVPFSRGKQRYGDRSNRFWRMIYSAQRLFMRVAGKYAGGTSRRSSAGRVVTTASTATRPAPNRTHDSGKEAYIAPQRSPNGIGGVRPAR